MRITRRVMDRMTEHAFSELPNECCGMLSGEDSLIDGIKRCRNERSSPSEFSISPPELFEFFRSLRGQEREFMGVYHSHPDGKDTPSRRDEEEFYYQGSSYWIVSLNNGLASVRCFEWGQAGFVEVPFMVMDRSGLPALPPPE